MKKLIVLVSIILYSINSFSQLPSPAMVGYWENWGGSKMVKLKDVNPLYNVICVAFTENSANYNVKFTPSSPYTNDTFIKEIKMLQSEGRKVLISIGGQNGSLNIRTEEEKNIFISSVNEMIDYWGFDGLDIDIEGKKSLNFSKIKINDRDNRDPRINFLIDGIREILENHKTTHKNKLLLTMAPETAYVHGGLSNWTVQNAYGGAYLPIIEELRDEIDMLNVQLYNSGETFGLDGKIYKQGTVDWVIALTEGIIEGFTSLGGIGKYSGLPEDKVGVGLPGCHSSDAVPHHLLQRAMNYLLGKGPKPGSYTLRKEGGYPDLKGMMTWSITSDFECDPSYGFVSTFSKIFLDTPFIEAIVPEKIYEGSENGGRIEVNLTKDSFISSLNKKNWSIIPLLPNISIDTIRRISDQKVEVILLGNSSEVYDLYSNEVTIVIDKEEFINSDQQLRTKINLVQKAPLFVPGLIEAEYFSNGISTKIVNIADGKGIDVRTAYGSAMEYQINVESTGLYDLIFNFSSGKGTLNMSTKIDGVSNSTIAITTNQKFQTYVYDTISVNLEEGIHSIEFDLTKHWMFLNNIEFKKSIETSLSVTKADNKIQFYPNPSSKLITFMGEIKGEMKIYDSSGRLILNTNLSKNETLDISNLKNGIYIIQFHSKDGEVINNKLIKN